MIFIAPPARRCPATSLRPHLSHRLAALTVLASWLATSGMGGGALPATAASPYQTKSAPKSTHKAKKVASPAPAVHWLTSLPEALKQAKQLHKPVLVDFYTTWCGPCKMLEKYTFPNADFVRESRKWVMVKLDAEASPDNVRATRVYQVTGYPTLAFLANDGTLVGGAVGYWESPGLLKLMREAAAKIH